MWLYSHNDYPTVIAGAYRYIVMESVHVKAVYAQRSLSLFVEQMTKHMAMRVWPDASKCVYGISQ